MEEVTGSEVRSIPAHAGEPPVSSRRPPPYEVDPRSRGGAISPCLRTRPFIGRSPLTRGSPKPPGRGPRESRSIPAHAGEPSLPLITRSRRAVDPRSRGGAPSLLAFIVFVAGRSPLTRGSLHHPEGGLGRLGSIPAHAGEPWADPPYPSSAEVDPRSRGGANLGGLSQLAATGRSPLTRGSPTRGSHSPAP